MHIATNNFNSTKKRAGFRQAVLLFCTFTAAFTVPASSQTNVLVNPSFATTINNWTPINTTPCVSNAAWDASGAAKLTITTVGTQRWHQKFYQSTPIISGQKYFWQFRARASAARTVDFVIERTGGDYYKAVDVQKTLTTSYQTFSGTFALPAGVLGGSYSFSFFSGLAAGSYYVDDCVFYPVYTITASAGTGGTISPNGAVEVANGANQSFTITANTGYQVADVQVDGASIGAVTSYQFTNLTAPHTISATFSVTTNTITATAGAGGTISPSGAVIVNYGANQTFSITPLAGYRIANVMVDGVSAGAVATYTFSNVIAAHSISASFALLTNTITATAGAGGTISPSGAVIVNYGASQTFAITPNAGYQIASVLVDGSSVGAVASYQFTNVTTAHTIAASFSAGSNTITATAGAGGTISPSGAVSVPYGGNQTFTITPSTGYQISNLLVDGIAAGALATYTFTNVIAAHTIAAQFSLVEYDLTLTVLGSGRTSPAGTVKAQRGIALSITAIPDAGFIFSGWVVVAGTVTITNPSAAVTQVTLADGNAAISAGFTPDAGSVPFNKQLAISGTLSDAAGNPLGNPDPELVDATARLYSTPSSGIALYTETFHAVNGKAVTVDNGLFVIRLGSGTTADNLQAIVSANDNLYVEITIDAETPDVLMPRTPLTASAYSITGPAQTLSARIARGNGNPNLLGLEGTIGSYYVDNETQSTWLKADAEWKRID
jgi:hypothetical protein